jgi:hypothetical protein
MTQICNITVVTSTYSKLTKKIINHILLMLANFEFHVLTITNTSDSVQNCYTHHVRCAQQEVVFYLMPTGVSYNQ